MLYIYIIFKIQLIMLVLTLILPDHYILVIYYVCTKRSSYFANGLGRETGKILDSIESDSGLLFVRAARLLGIKLN